MVTEAIMKQSLTDATTAISSIAIGTTISKIEGITTQQFNAVIDPVEMQWTMANAEVRLAVSKERSAYLQAKAKKEDEIVDKLHEIIEKIAVEAETNFKPNGNNLDYLEYQWLPHLDNFKLRVSTLVNSSNPFTKTAMLEKSGRLRILQGELQLRYDRAVEAAADPQSLPAECLDQIEQLVNGGLDNNMIARRMNMRPEFITRVMDYLTNRP